MMSEFMDRGKKFQRFIYVALLVSLLLIAGCTASEQEPISADNVDEQMITITDCIGRKVQVPVRIERIACLYAFSGHTVTMLGKGEKIVASVEGLKRDALMTKLCPAIESAAIPSTSGSINVEELLRVQPDVAFIQRDTAQNTAQMEKLGKTGIPFLVVDFNNMEEQKYAVKMIGAAIGAEDKAEEYIRFYDNCLEKIRAKVKDIPPEKKVRIYHSVNEAVRTDSKGTLPADWTEAAGVINVSVNEDLKFSNNKYFANMEQILLWNPDAILVNEQGVADYILTEKQWAPLKAVQNKRVYQMPNGISRWGHPGSLETPLAVLWTCKILYPELCQDIDMMQETKSFYQDFFNLDLSDEMAAKVLSGIGMREPKKKGA
jgi:iron complex transport system substrate-binding protein